MYRDLRHWLDILRQQNEVVDEDIDPTNLDDVIWAIVTRTSPERAIEITRWTCSSSADPAVSPLLEDGGSHSAGLYTSKAIIDACWPWEWRERAFPVVNVSDETRAVLSGKFADVLCQIVR